MTENEIGKVVINSAIEIHKAFGPGLYDVVMSLDKTEIVKRLKQIK